MNRSLFIFFVILIPALCFSQRQEKLFEFDEPAFENFQSARVKTMTIETKRAHTYYLDDYSRTEIRYNEAGNPVYRLDHSSVGEETIWDTTYWKYDDQERLIEFQKNSLFDRSFSYYSYEKNGLDSIVNEYCYDLDWLAPKPRWDSTFNKYIYRKSRDTLIYSSGDLNSEGLFHANSVTKTYHLDANLMVEESTHYFEFDPGFICAKFFKYTEMDSMGRIVKTWDEYLTFRDWKKSAIEKNLYPQLEKEAEIFSYHRFTNFHIPSIREKILSYLKDHPNATSEELADTLNIEFDPRDIFYTDLLFRESMKNPLPLVKTSIRVYEYRDNQMVEYAAMYHGEKGRDIISKYNYDRKGKLIEVDDPQIFPNGLDKRIYSYNKQGLPKKLIFSHAAGAVAKITFTYTYYPEH